MERKKLVKRCLFLVALSAVFLTIILIMARYEEEGEKDIPFDISKILVVSSVDGVNKENTEHIWDINVSQVNDVYVYLDVIEDPKKVIKNVSFENFKVINNESEDIKIYRPTGDLEKLYTYSKENYIDKSIVFEGAQRDDIQNLEISCIGGMCGFRIANENLGEFISDEESEEITYDGRLLNKLGITNENIKLEFSFDIIVEIADGIKYKGTILLNMPENTMFTDGKSTIEINNFEDIVFKRI